MTNPSEDILISMTLLRAGAQGKTKNFQHAIGSHQARLKVWQIRAINYTILIGMISTIGLTIYNAL